MLKIKDRINIVMLDTFIYRNDMNASDLEEYFGKNHKEHISNGVVRWQFIEDKLLSDIDLSSHSCEQKTLATYLRFI